MASVIIAAHDEEAVIGACLDALQRQRDIEDLHIVVSANGCTDRTAERAGRPGVTVIDRPEAGKAGALNAGDAVAIGTPRIYLDADIIAPPHAVASLSRELARSGTLVAVPRRRVALDGRAWPVRSYFAINERLPAFRDGLFGRGLIALSAEGRARFETFPELIADDLFLDSLFTLAERAQAADVEVVVEAPHTTKALIDRLIRVRRGNTQMRSALGDHVRKSDKWAWLRDVVVPQPSLVFAAIPYVAITLLAGFRARRSSASGNAWTTDSTTRGPSADATEGAS